VDKIEEFELKIIFLKSGEMNFSLKQALKMFVIFACAIGVVGTSVMITNKNTDNAKSKNDSLWMAVILAVMIVVIKDKITLF